MRSLPKKTPLKDAQRAEEAIMAAADKLQEAIEHAAGIGLIVGVEVTERFNVDAGALGAYIVPTVTASARISPDDLE